MIKIIENYLPEESFNNIIGLIESPGNFDWYLSPKAVDYSNTDTSFQFMHHMILDGKMMYSNAESYIKMLVRPLKKTVKVHRCKVNLFVNQKESIGMGFHRDYAENEIKTLLIYLEDSNGYTEFETGEKIESKKNRAIIFQSNLKHQTVSQTDTMFRRNINLNYEETE